MNAPSAPGDTILVIDDETPVRLALERMLQREGHRCSGAADVEEAREILAGQTVALMLTDINMPGETGLELAAEVLGDKNDVAVVMVTGVDDAALALAALDLGAYGYVIKPFERSEIVIAVDNALRRRALEIENRAHRDQLELLVAERTARLEFALEDVHRAEAALLEAYEETILRLGAAAEFRDPVTGTHIRNISRTCVRLGESVGLEPAQIEVLRIASPMHDIGKIGVPDSVLLKPGPLDDVEWELIRRHPAIGHAILDGSDTPLLQVGALVALTHHEKWDGTGYPAGLRGEAIPLEARIVAVADVFDALTNERPYKEAYSFERAMEMMVAERGRHFDPDILDAFVAIAHDLAREVARSPEPTVRSAPPTRAGDSFFGGPAPTGCQAGSARLPA